MVRIDRGTEEASTGVTLHLTTEDVWAAHERASLYYPERFADEGFVHCTDGEAHVIDVGNRYYRADPRPFLVLDVDLSKVRARAIYEDEARIYPHIYGPIDRDAILRVRRVERAGNGSFLRIGSPVEAPAA
jgi:uncharacterized protein (DUF952 family)